MLQHAFFRVSVRTCSRTRPQRTKQIHFLNYFNVRTVHLVQFIIHTNKCTQHIHRVSLGECAILRKNVPYVKVHRYNPKHLYPKLNGYGDKVERKVWSSCGSTYCPCFACCYPYTAHVRPSVSQPSQAHSAFIINRCHSYSEL